MVSIGGNDVGFSRLRRQCRASDQSLLRQLGGWFGEVQGFLDANARLDRLEDLYKSLNRAIAQHPACSMGRGGPDSSLTSYPRLALLEDGSTVCPDGRAGMTVVQDFALECGQGAQFGRGCGAARCASWRTRAGSMAGPSSTAIAARSSAAASAQAGATTRSRSTDDLRLPRKIGGKWEPYNPADWKPYASRQRWFRTPNDAFMTGNFHVSASLLQRALKLQALSWFQLLLASTLFGCVPSDGRRAGGDGGRRRGRSAPRAGEI